MFLLRNTCLWYGGMYVSVDQVSARDSSFYNRKRTHTDNVRQDKTLLMQGQICREFKEMVNWKVNQMSLKLCFSTCECLLESTRVIFLWVFPLRPVHPCLKEVVETPVCSVSALCSQKVTHLLLLSAPVLIFLFHGQGSWIYCDFCLGFKCTMYVTGTEGMYLSRLIQVL